MKDIKECFDILGLNPGASLDEVKEAYRDLVKVWHPDRFSHDDKLQHKAQEKLKEINEAYAAIETFLDNLKQYQQASSSYDEINKGENNTSNNYEAYNQSQSSSSKTKHDPHGKHNEQYYKAPDSGGFWETLFNGDFGLAKTYWIFGVLVGIIVKIFSHFITSSGLSVILLLAYLPYSVVVFIGTWRAADKYPGQRTWATLAKIGVVLGCTVLVIGLMALGGIQSKSVQEQALSAPWAYYPKPAPKESANQGNEGEKTIGGLNAVDWFNKGSEAESANRWREAVGAYKKAIKLKPDYAEAYNFRGLAYWNLDNNQQAIKDYTKTLELKPDYAEAYFNRGNAYYDLGNYQQAINDYSKAIELKPDYAWAYGYRGVSYYKVGNDQQAINDYSKAIELKPDYAQAYYGRVFAYSRLGNKQQAISDLKTAARMGYKIAQEVAKKRGIDW